MSAVLLKQITFLLLFILCIGLVSGALTDGQVSYYAFDVNSSSQTDSVGSNTGIVSGATYISTGKINGAYDFNGVANNVRANDFSIGSNYSVSAWLKPDAVEVSIAFSGGGSTINRYPDILMNSNGGIYTRTSNSNSGVNTGINFYSTGTANMIG